MEILYGILAVIGGLLAVVVGLCLFVLFSLALYSVTTAFHSLGTFWGHFLATMGQELVAVLLLLGWSVVLWGWFWIVGVPEEASLAFVFSWFVLPPFVLWLVAKVYTIKTTWALWQRRLFQIIWLITIVWAFRPYVTIATLIPRGTLSTYYGNVQNSNILLGRLGETAFMADAFRWYRGNILDAGGPKTLIKELSYTEDLLNSWHSKREKWGGTRNNDASLYERQVKLVIKKVLKDELAGGGAHDFRETREATISLVDSWWKDQTEIPADAISTLGEE